MVAQVAPPARSRLLRALAAGLLVLVGLGTALAATGPGQAEPTLSVPAVRAGDRGDYAATIEHLDGSAAGLRAGHWTAFRFLWRDSALRGDAEGRLHAVNVLETYTEVTPGAGWTTSWAEWSLDAATGATVVVEERWAASGYTSDASTPGQWTTVGNLTSFGEGAAPCGLRSSLQGRTSEAGESAVLVGGCGAEAGLGTSGRSLFHYAGRDTVDGRPAFRFAAADGPTQVWFASGIAAPVQILQPAVADGQVRDVLVRLRLVGWESGAAVDVVPSVPPASTAAAPLAWTSRDRLTGPALGGAHPFPHTEAWWLAMQDSRSGLTSFFAAHPDAFLAGMESHITTDAATTRFTWDFKVTDGKFARGVFVTKQQASAGTVLALPAATPPAEVGTFTVESNAAWLPDPDQMPSQYPTFVSLADRWTALTGRTTAPLTYGFGVSCSFGCNETVAWSYAGIAREDLGIDTSARHEDYIVFDALDGSLALGQQGSQVVAQLAVGDLRPLPPLATTRPPPEPPAATAAVAATLLWSPVGAGTFAAALAVAVVTYLWPTLKHALVGLFSRLTPDAIAAHPTRQAILEALQAEPGIHFQALCRKLGKGRGVVGHHVAKLVADGKVVSHRRGGFVCYFLAGQGATAGTVAQVTALKAEGAQRLLDEIRRHPGRSGLELAQTTGMAASTVHYHAKRLLDAGLVVSTPRGRSLTLMATPSSERAVAGSA